MLGEFDPRAKFDILNDRIERAILVAEIDSQVDSERKRVQFAGRWRAVKQIEAQLFEKIKRALRCSKPALLLPLPSGRIALNGDQRIENLNRRGLNRRRLRGFRRFDSECAARPLRSSRGLRLN